MYAIIENGSHQYRVAPGDTLTIDKRVEEPGSEIAFEKVLLVVGEDGQPRIGSPIVAGVTVTAKIVRTYRGKKILIQKFRRRKGYRRKRGHRQTYTTVKILQIA